MSMFDAFFDKCKQCGNSKAFDVKYGSCRECTWGFIKGDLPPPIPFFKGDKVTAFGNIGEVKSISVNGMFVFVKFPEFDSTVAFNIDGRFSSWCKEVSLRHV